MLKMKWSHPMKINYQPLKPINTLPPDRRLYPASTVILKPKSTGNKIDVKV